MISCLLLVTGTTTYSWFTSTATTAPGSITVGTFNLKLDTEDNADTAMFNMDNLQPGVPTEKKTVSFTNTGSLDMILRIGEISVEAKDENNPTSVGDKSAYKIIAYIYKDDLNNLIYKSEVNGKEISEAMDLFKNNANSILDAQSGGAIVFKPNDKCIFELKLILSEELAKNPHQGDTVIGTLRMEARQNIENSSYAE
jgi:predicted ribosomally synthesized peptide with SipW-like signal peptide